MGIKVGGVRMRKLNESRDKFRIQEEFMFLNTLLSCIGCISIEVEFIEIM